MLGMQALLDDSQLYSQCRLNESLAENKELSGRLIDQALQNEEDMFDAAFSETQAPAARSPPPEVRASAVEKRQAELTQQVKSFHLDL